MKRLLYFMLFMLCVLSQVRAQMYNVYVKNKEGVPLSDVIVYSFPTKVMGEKAVNELKEQYLLSEKSKNNIVEESKTDADGLCVIKAFPAGSILLDGGDAKPKLHGVDLFQISQYQKDAANFDLYFVLRGLDDDAKTLREVVTTAMPPMAAAGDGTAESHGNKITVSRDVDIVGEYARGDARFVAFPFVVLEETGDTVYVLPPAAVDGEDYSKSMTRRMSFDASRDKLSKFRFDHSMHMQDHCSERFKYKAEFVKMGKFHAPGILWYEDYNGVYQRDSILFSDGKERVPMRFLEWSSVFDVAPIDREYYAKRGVFESIPDDASFNLDFAVNSTSLNMDDTATVAGVDSMMRWLGGHYAGGAIQDIEIRGYSSPEGGEANNRRLSHGRAETIRAMLARNFPRVDHIVPKFDPIYDNIVPWQDVVKYVMEEMPDTVARANAARVQEIVEGITDIDDQNSALMKHPELYGYMKANVLPRVRRVDVKANVIVQKILTKEEVVTNYETKPNFRDAMVPYQYYIIMCYLADEKRWEELRNVSRQAYKKYERERLAKKTVLKNPTDTVPVTVEEMVPYPLAGYYYAMSTLRCGQSDTLILAPYLDDGGIGNRKDYPFMNGKPFLVGQVLMHCQAGDFDKADKLIVKYGLANFSDLTELIMFVRCLDGQYRDGYKHAAAVREYVMKSSPMNRAVMLTALGYYREALDLLYSENVPVNDAKVEYMKAICHFRLQPTKTTELSADGFSGSVMYAGAQDEPLGEEKRTIHNPVAWAAPMLNAIRLDNSNLEYLEEDGYFNNAYRQMVAYFWKRLQNGVPIERVVTEYDALISQMRKEKAQETVN